MATTDEQKEVLVVFKDRRRPIVFKCSTDPEEEYQHILESVNEVFADVLLSGEGTTSYYLQRDSKVWGQIDLNSKDKLADHEILHIQLSVSLSFCMKLSTLT